MVQNMEQSLRQRWIPVIPRLKFAEVIASLNQNAYVGTLGVFLAAGIATLNGRTISVGLPDLRGAMGFGFDEAILAEWRTPRRLRWVCGPE